MLWFLFAALLAHAQSSCVPPLEKVPPITEVLIAANCRVPQTIHPLLLFAFAKFVQRPSPSADLHRPASPAEIERFFTAAEKLHRAFNRPCALTRDRIQHIIPSMRVQLYDVIAESIQLTTHHEPADPAAVDAFFNGRSPARKEVKRVADYVDRFFERRDIKHQCHLFRLSLAKEHSPDLPRLFSAALRRELLKSAPSNMRVWLSKLFQAE